MSSEVEAVALRLDPLKLSIEEDGKFLYITFPGELKREQRLLVSSAFQNEFPSEVKPLLRPPGAMKNVARIGLNGCDRVDCAIAALSAIYQWPPNSLDRADIQKRITEQKSEASTAPAPSPHPDTKAETPSSEPPQKTNNESGENSVEIDKSILKALQFSTETDKGRQFFCIHFPVDLTTEDQDRVGLAFQAFPGEMKPIRRSHGAMKNVAKIGLHGCDAVDCAIAAISAVYQWPPNSLDRADIQKRITEQKFEASTAPAPSPHPDTKAETPSSEPPQKTNNESGENSVEIDKSILKALQFSTETDKGRQFFCIHFPVYLSPEERGRVSSAFQKFTSEMKPLLRPPGAMKNVARIGLNGCDPVDCVIAALSAIYQWPPNSLDRADIQKRITEQKFEASAAPAMAPKAVPSLDNIDFHVTQTVWVREAKVRFPDPVPDDVLNSLNGKVGNRREQFQRNRNDPREIISRGWVDPYESIRLIVVSVLKLQQNALASSDIRTVICRRSAEKVSYSSESRQGGKVATTLFLEDEMFIEMDELKRNMTSRDCAVRPLSRRPIKQIVISGFAEKQVDDVCACLEFMYQLRAQKGVLNKDDVKKWLVERDHAHQQDPNLPVVQVSAAALKEICLLLGLPNLKTSLTVHF